MLDERKSQFELMIHSLERERMLQLRVSRKAMRMIMQMKVGMMMRRVRKPLVAVQTLNDAMDHFFYYYL